MKRKTTVCLAGVLTMVWGTSGAQAAVLDASADSTTLVLVNQNATLNSGMETVTTLNAPSAGELSVTLTSMQFSSSSAPLQFALTDLNSLLAGPNAPGTLLLDLTQPMIVYADIFASGPAGSVGLYNLTADFSATSAVPLPASAMSLIGALLVLFYWASNPSLSRAHSIAQETVTSCVA